MSAKVRPNRYEDGTKSGKAKAPVAQANASNVPRRAPKKSSTPTSSNASKPGSAESSGPGQKTASAANSSVSKKRARDLTPSGLTPPAKRPLRTFSYASATAGAVELAIVTKDMAHCRREDFNKLREVTEEAYLEEIDKGEELLSVDKWLYTFKVASVHVADKRTYDVLKGLTGPLGLTVMPMAELEEMRKPTTILTGLVTGPAAQKDRACLDKFLAAELRRLRIQGRVEIYQTIPTRAGNLLLKVVVDEDAKEELKASDFSLRIGASGLVKFQDDRAALKLVNEDETNQSPSIDEVEAKKAQAAEQARIAAQRAELEEELQREKSKIAAIMARRRELDAIESASVGSCGISNLDVDDTEEEASTSKPSTIFEDAEEMEADKEEALTPKESDERSAEMLALLDSPREEN